MNDEARLRKELIPELAEYLCETENGFELDHRFVRELWVSPDRITYLNELFQSKEALAMQALEERDWSGYIELHERPHRLCAFLEVMQELDDKSYWELLAHFWIDTENARQNRLDWKELWNSERSQKQFAMNVEERTAFELMPDEINVYRGGVGTEIAGGLSWSLSREKAARFARRHQGHVIMTALAKKHDMHAYFKRRNEEEVVIENVRIVDQEMLTVARSDSSRMV